MENDHNVICIIIEDVAEHFTFPNFTSPVSLTLSKIVENNTTTREKKVSND